MKLLLRNFLIIAVMLWILSFVSLTGQVNSIMQIIYILNILTIVFYYTILNRLNKLPVSFYTNKSLAGILFIYSLIFVSILKFIYFDHHGDFFAINGTDVLTYDGIAYKLRFYSLINIIKSFLKDNSFADLGAVLYVTLIYKIIPSTLLVDFINIIISVLAAVSLFKLASYFMPLKYSYLCSLSYFCSSYIIQFEASGLKESLFMFIVIASFLNYYRYTIHHKIKYLILVGIFSATILLFRPAVFGFFLLSIGAGFLLKTKQSFIYWIITIVVIIVGIYTVNSIQELFTQYSSFDESIEIRTDALSKAGKNIAIYAAVISSLFGPLPTLLPVAEKEIVSINSIGLIFRALLSIPFWFGVFYIIKRKQTILLPLIFLVLIEMGSLIYILESYELRFHLLHLPFVYIISFYYLYRQNSSTFAQRSNTRLIFNYCSVGVFLLIIYWNSRLI